MATIVGEKLSSGDRRSPGRRFWDAHKDILKSIAHEEFMAAHGLTDWAAAPVARWSSASYDTRSTQP